MYRIICYTTGSYIKIPQSLYYEMAIKMPANIKKNIHMYNYYSDKDWQYFEANEEEAAKWFLSHRLVYNPKRQDPRKLEFMKTLFEFNGIPGWQTVKLEFDVEKI